MRDAAISDPQSVIDDLLSSGNRVNVILDASESQELVKKADDLIFKARQGLEELDDLTKLLKNDITNKFFNNAGDILK